MTGRLSNAITNNVFLNYERICLRVLIGAYRIIYSQKQYELDWDEDQFTEWLIVEMKKHDLTSKHRLHIFSQSLIRKEELPINDNHPKISPKIDIGFWNWEHTQNAIEYFIEAKNLSLDNWKKKTGVAVSATSYLNRYIETGIGNFTTCRYTNGSLVGYVLNGDIEPIVQKLNERLTESQQLKCISENYNIEDYPHIYLSEHSTKDTNVKIKHVFLSFV